jgi:hypothetical protein
MSSSADLSPTTTGSEQRSRTSICSKFGPDAARSSVVAHSFAGRAMTVDNLGGMGMIAGLRPRACAAVEDR